MTSYLRDETGFLSDSLPSMPNDYYAQKISAAHVRIVSAELGTVRMRLTPMPL